MTRQDAPSRNRLDFLVPLLMAGMLLGSCLMTSRQKPFWFDEILTYYFVTDPSLAHMLTAQADLINASPPLYFLLARLWTQLFGTTELAFRMLSSVGCITGCTAIWWVLRRTYGSWPAAVAAIVVLMSSRQLLYNNAEARFYGMLFAELAVAVCLYARLCRQAQAGIGTLLANAAVHAALVTTHYFGLFYSGTFLVAFFLFHRKERRKLLPCVCSVVLGWVAFVPCLPAFFQHAQLGGPYGWLGPPTVIDLVEVYTTNREFVGLVAMSLMGLAILVERLSCGAPSRNADPSAKRGENPGVRSLLTLSLCLLTLPVGVWVYSQSETPVFVDRYLWPVVVMAWCLVVAHITSRILGDSRSEAEMPQQGPKSRVLAMVPKLVLGLLCLLCLIVPLQVHHHAPAPLREFLRQFSGLRAALPRDLPVVFEDPLGFLECKFYHDRDNRYVVVLDKDWAMSPENRRRRANQFAIASALQRQYSIRALPAGEFVRKHQTFAFVPTDGALFEKWVKSREEFAWVGRKSGRGHFYVVSRQADPSPEAGRAESLTQYGALDQTRQGISNR